MEWRSTTADGEIVLRERDGVTELIVNGVFAMDSSEVSSEWALADALGRDPGRVLVGGLGLGYTAARLLANGAAALVVAERSAPLLEWAWAGATGQLAALAGDERVSLVGGDIVEVVAASADAWDAILLDVDNGPTFLIHDDNARVYQAGFLADCAAHLVPGGHLLVWCEAASPALEDALRTHVGPVRAEVVPVTRGERCFDYLLYQATTRR